jgi:hypothetical protein
MQKVLRATLPVFALWLAVAGSAHAAAPAFGGELYNFANNSTNNPPGTVTLSSGVPAGAMVVVLGTEDGNDYTITAVTDTKGNAYSQAVSYQNKNFQSCNQFIWYAPVTNALTANDTLTIKWSGSGLWRSYGIDVIYLTGATQLDSIAMNNGYMYGTSVSIPGATVATNTVVVGMLAANDFAWTPGAGWAIHRSNNVNIYYDFFHKTLSASGSTDPGGTGLGGNTYSGVWAAFKGQVSPPTPAITSFTANPASLVIGSSSLLSWNVSNASSVAISGNNLNFTSSMATGTVSVTPTATGTFAYTLTATNVNGSSVATTSVMVNAPPTVPAAPQNLAAVAGNSQISLSWQAPTSNGGSPITAYLIYDRTTGSPTFNLTTTTTQSQTSAIIASLANGQSYDFEVIAQNAIGNSAPSNVVSATPIGPVPAIVSFVASPALIAFGSSSLLSWNVSNASSLTISGNNLNFTSSMATGTVSVTPTATGTFVYTLTATNVNGSSVATTSVMVKAGGAPAFGGELYNFANNSTDNPPGTVTLSSGVPAGAMVVVLGTEDGNDYTITAVTDTKGNAYSQAVSYQNKNFQSCNQFIWYAPVTNALTANDTLTIKWSGSGLWRSYGIDVIYLTGATQLDSIAMNNGYMYGTSVNIPGATVATNTVVVGMLAANDFAWTPDAGWTIHRSNNVDIYYDFFHKTLSASGSTDSGGTGLGGNTYSGVWAAFK